MTRQPVVLKSREISDIELHQMLHAAVASGDILDIFFEQFEYHFLGQHDLGWKVSLNGSQYDSLVGYVASSCLHALACLYRQHP